ncbi:GNAT family N-acetyltransferase [Povalibacter sp.]|uniref:GNAT family N-acetyltransferase n=1 Tax=Povalibacter sp. TaxID=1962978 RepID=UPI002F402C22
MIVRPAFVHDIPQLLRLMHGLAEFEGYRDRFAVTEADLLERGFNRERDPQFHVFVAADANENLCGYALTYFIPFTFDLRPTLVLKEFFVAADQRGEGVGHKLFRAVLDHGRQAGVRLLRWQVLPSNEGAKRFYASFGGTIDADWDNWVLPIETGSNQQ